MAPGFFFEIFNTIIYRDIIQDVKQKNPNIVLNWHNGTHYLRAMNRIKTKKNQEEAQWEKEGYEDRDIDYNELVI